MTENVPIEVLAERASKAIAKMYTDWGPGPLPWAMAERFVMGALEMAVAQERRAIAAWLRRRPDFGVLPADNADAIERGEHATQEATT